MPPIPIYPPWVPGTPGMSTGEEGDHSDPSSVPTFLEKTLTVAAENSVVPVAFGEVPLGAMVFAVGITGTQQEPTLTVGYAFCLGGLLESGVASLICLDVDGSRFHVGDEKNGVTFHAWLDGSPTQAANSQLGVIGCTDTLTGTLDGEDYGISYAVLEIAATDPIPTPVAFVNVGPRNPALALAQWIESKITGYGKSVDAVKAAQHCNDPPFKREMHLAFETTSAIDSRLDEIRGYAACDINMSGDTVVLVPRKRTGGVVSMILTPTDMVMDTFEATQPATSDVPNHVLVGWTFRNIDSVGFPGDTDQCWEERTAYAEAYWDDGSGERRTQVIAMPGIIDPSQAQREANDRLNYYRYKTLTVEFETFDYALSLLVGDVVEVQHPLLGSLNPHMRVVEVETVSLGRWKLSLETHDDRMYSDATAPYPDWPTYDFPPGQSDPVPAPSDLVLTEKEITVAPCVKKFNLLIEWTFAGYGSSADFHVLVYAETEQLIGSFLDVSIAYPTQNEVLSNPADQAPSSGDYATISGMMDDNANGTWLVETPGSPPTGMILENARRPEGEFIVSEDITSTDLEIIAPDTISYPPGFSGAAVAGQTVTLSGWANPANNGTFTVDADQDEQDATIIKLDTVALVSESLNATGSVALKGGDITFIEVGEEAIFDEIVYGKTSVLVTEQLEPGETYRVLVQAVDRAVNSRASSQLTGTITLSSVPILVPDVTGFTAYTALDAVVQLLWEDVIICYTGYEIRRGDVDDTWESADFIARVDALRHVDIPTVVINEKTYRYFIKAFTGTYGVQIEYSINAAHVDVAVKPRRLEACCPPLCVYWEDQFGVENYGISVAEVSGDLFTYYAKIGNLSEEKAENCEIEWFTEFVPIGGVEPDVSVEPDLRLKVTSDDGAGGIIVVSEGILTAWATVTCPNECGEEYVETTNKLYLTITASPGTS